MAKKFKYHTGDKFWHWTLVSYAGNGRWTAKCDCGKIQDCLINHLAKGKSISCMSCSAERRKKLGYFNVTEYRTWNSMRQRCLNSNNDRYHQYGGRGITICKEWESFDVFLSDMGKRPDGTSLDRIDVDGPYSKENCRWATPKEQMRNRRIHKIKPFVEKEPSNIKRNNYGFCVTELSEIVGIQHGTLRSRLNRGWDVDKAISTPVNVKSESVCAQARVNGLPEATVLCRVNRGWSLERALSTPVQEKDFTIGEKARARGLSVSIVSNRIRNGWSEERALNTPILKRVSNEN